MILANARQSLTRRDAELAIRLIARGSESELARGQDRLRDGGMDVVLDDPRLVSALVQGQQGAHASLPLFAYVMVRQALRESGEEDRSIADFVASILIHFGIKQRSRQVAEHDDQLYDTLASLLADVERGDPARAFMVRAHLGNYALWLSGLFPDFIEARRWRRGGPDLDYYEEMGRRGYQLAAQHRMAEQHGMTQLFVAAAERFPRLRVALNRVSDRTMFPGVHTPQRLMRQVRDAARWSLS